jgi:hypothetical protein
MDFSIEIVEPSRVKDYDLVLLITKNTHDWVYIGHGNADGSCNIPLWKIEDARYIIVCYPNAVRAALPEHLRDRIVGDWDGETYFTNKLIDGRYYTTARAWTDADTARFQALD